MNDEDRMWAIRDALLRWQYIEATRGSKRVTLDVSDLERETKWSGAHIRPTEADQATAYLVSQGLIRGSAHPDGRKMIMITADGQNKAATGMSVKPGPPKEANTTGVTNNYTFNNHGPSNNAVNSSDFTQTITVDQKTEKILEVADALEAHADSGPANADEARRIAADLREAAPEPEENKSKLLSYLGSAIGAFTLAAGTTAGQQATQLAVEALQSLA
ncbi:serine recombinase [Rhodococcus sp. NPDC056506]|uniref:serine recombinase n=1 Tax=Rhodococcus sp. NPDC056506 TaxID=3345844 RepID=UPI00366E3532